MAGSDPSDLLEAMRRVRDAGMDAWARTTRQVTNSTPYARLTGLLSQPGLIAAAFFRKASEKAMSRLLRQLNIPSRADVLSISLRTDALPADTKSHSHSNTNTATERSFNRGVCRSFRVAGIY